MLDLIGSTFVSMLSTWTIAYLLLGVMVGLLVGILPALGTVAGLALLIPFVFGMDPLPAIAMMTGLLAVTATGDTVTSVMLGIPGSPASQATVLDGFPLAKKGEAARALSAAYLSRSRLWDGRASYARHPRHHDGKHIVWRKPH